MRPRPIILLVATLAVSTSFLRAQHPQPRFEPWFYRTNGASSGQLLFEPHQYEEDNSNTVFTLARELATFSDQAIPRPELVLCNFAHFEPPEGDPAAPGQRRLLWDSIHERGVQVWLNLTSARIDPTGSTAVYPDPMFFIAPGIVSGPQPTVRTLPNIGFARITISATRAAFGEVGVAGTPHRRAALQHEEDQGFAPAVPYNAIYVTAGIRYGLAAFTPNDQGNALLARTDQLWVRNGAGIWQDQSALVPLALRESNNAGACFADFDGDGYMDLYVGRHGDDYTGLPNALLLWDPTTSTFKDASGNLETVSDATNEVVAADVDGDGDQDIAVANRARRDGQPAGLESRDYVLLNVGGGHFKREWLAEPARTDTRSVAVGDLDRDGVPEIVLGNAGNDEFSNVATPTGDDPTQIFRRISTQPLTWADDWSRYLTPTLEPLATSPWTQQVLLVDIASWNGTAPTATATPDGKLDLAFVNWRDILRQDGNHPVGANVWLLAQPNTGTATQFRNVAGLSVEWTRSVAFADVVRGFWTGTTGNTAAPSPSLDMVCGRGNRFSGVQAKLYQNIGTLAGTPWPFNIDGNQYMNQLLSYDPLPGTMHGYGFDFADIDDDGHMDAVQTSRGYNFLVADMMQLSLWHLNLTEPLQNPTQQLSNARGLLRPNGAEDGVFADFDGDDDLDLLLAGSTSPSFEFPSPKPWTPEAIFLRNDYGLGSVSGPFSMSTGPLPGTTLSTIDLRIDQKGRVGPHPKRSPGGDRVVAGDLDNDGDVDAIVHMFGIPDASGKLPTIVNGNGFPNPPGGFAINYYLYGWRYLRNLSGTGSSFQFEDIATTHMKPSATGAYQQNWNRGLGMDLLGDYDNNGALDLLTTIADDQLVGTDVSVTMQRDDLLFFNGGLGAVAPIGTLIRANAGVLPQAVNTVNALRNAGTRGAAQGDIDNDGDLDLVLTHHGRTGDTRTAFPSLLINRLSEPAAAFVNEYLPNANNGGRVPVLTSQLSPAVHSSVDPQNPQWTRDETWFPALFDFDADGDLDLVIQVGWNIPRFYRNRGEDLNQDGVIDAADNSALGFFEDVTGTAAARIRPTHNAEDMQPVDIDADGDLDLAIDPFFDEVVFWRNDLDLAAPALAGRPAITEAWPRIGSKRGTRITLHGVNFTAADMVEFRHANGTITQTSALQVVSDTRLRCQVPAGSAPGLAQVRVRRNLAGARTWGKQYFAYCVLQ